MHFGDTLVYQTGQGSKNIRKFHTIDSNAGLKNISAWKWKKIEEQPTANQIYLLLNKKECTSELWGYIISTLRRYTTNTVEAFSTVGDIISIV